MAQRAQGLVGSFRHLDCLLEAIQQLRQAGYRDLQTFSPVPHHTIDEALEKPPSPVRLFTLVGCILGGFIGLWLTIGASLHYPLMTGGKPIISIPPFLIIIFALTILLGGLLTIGGMLLNIRLPRMHLVPAYDLKFSGDRFGLWVPCEPRDFDAVAGLLEGTGAEEVRRVGELEAEGHQRVRGG
jgi:molybdopterin-containing oxidoreductase family membrane subunit